MKPTTEHSFHEARVLGWRLSPQSLELEVSNVNFAGEARGPAKLAFPLIKPVRAVSFDAASKRWLEEPAVEALKDIRKFHFKLERHYSMEGIGAESERLLALSIISSEARISW